jgi:hypothetical protein
MKVGINFTLGKSQSLQETINSAISSSRSLLQHVQILPQLADMSLSIFNLQINFSHYIVSIWYTCSAATQSSQSCASSMCFLQSTYLSHCLVVYPLLSLQLFLLELGLYTCSCSEAENDYFILIVATKI